MEQLIDRENPQKLYVQLYEILKRRIESGELAVDSQTPTEDELCRIYDVSKATIRLAISELARQGYLRRLQGKGTFVCKRVIPEGLSMITRMTSFKEMMLATGISFSTKVLAQTVLMPTGDLDIKLNVSADKHIIYIKRLRSADDEPVLLQESYIPYNICPMILNDDLENNSLLELMGKKYGLGITKVTGHIGIVYLNKDESELLGLPEGSCALLLEHHFYSDDSQIKYERSIKRTDRFKFFIEYDRKS